MRPLNRPVPRAPVDAFRTYQLAAPLPTHWRPARTCAEVECAAWSRGWASTFDERTDLGAEQARYVRHWSRRTFVESAGLDGLTLFDFPPGQDCFRLADHMVRLDRDALYIVRGGDWRGNTGLIRRHTSPGSWVDDFATHQQHVSDRVGRG